MRKKIYFISKDANWQLYRNEVLTKLAFEHDYEVEILTTGVLKDYLKENERLKYKIFPNVFNQKYKVNFFPAALKYIATHRPYAVIALNSSTNLTEYLALLLCRRKKIHFVWWTHGFDHLPLKNSFFRSIRKKYMDFFITKSDAIIVFSRKGKEYLVQNKVDGAKIYIASNTLDTDKIIKVKQQVAQQFDKVSFLKERFPDYGTASQSIILLFSGRLNKKKKVDDGIKAVQLLRNKGIDAKYLIVGDGAEKDNLIKLASDLKVEEHVYFSGYVFDDVEVSKYFLASDLFVMPGYIGLAIVHAFAFDLPLITENVTTHSPEIQFLENGVNGYFVKENDINELAELIAKIKSDSALFASLKSNAYKVVQNEANIHEMLKNMNTALVIQYKKPK